MEISGNEEMLAEALESLWISLCSAATL